MAIYIEKKFLLFVLVWLDWSVGMAKVEANIEQNSSATNNLISRYFLRTTSDINTMDESKKNLPLFSILVYN